MHEMYMKEFYETVWLWFDTLCFEIVSCKTRFWTYDFGNLSALRGRNDWKNEQKYQKIRGIIELCEQKGVCISLYLFLLFEKKSFLYYFLCTCMCTNFIPMFFRLFLICNWQWDTLWSLWSLRKLLTFMLTS